MSGAATDAGTSLDSPGFGEAARMSPEFCVLVLQRAVLHIKAYAKGVSE